jgi:hypothetical protein
MTVEQLIEKLKECPHPNTPVVVHTTDGEPVEVEWDLMGLSQTLFEYHIPVEVEGLDLEDLYGASAILEFEAEQAAQECSIGTYDIDYDGLFKAIRNVVDMIDCL